MLGTQGMEGGGGSSGDGGDGVMGSSGDEKGGGVSGGGVGDSYEGDRSSVGNRWPRQETLALLKIRSDMDAAFRDSSLKGPLWEEISRKMAELGYHRSGKKCKEKFENVYKYHKRTKDGRVAKADGKNYRFFDQLQAFDCQQQQQHSNYGSRPPSQSQPDSEEGEEAVPVTMLMPAGSIHHHVTVTSTGTATAPQYPSNTQTAAQLEMVVEQRPSRSESETQSSSSSTSSEEEAAAGSGSRKRKRKWKEMFEKMTKEVIKKQEDFQRRLMEAVEKRERDGACREDAWKAQELARLKHEHEILIQERSMAAAKDAALISFLKKISEQLDIPFPREIIHGAQLPLPQPQPPQPPLPPPPPPPPPKANCGKYEEMLQSGGGGGRLSRWPKAEVEALINLRTKMDSKYQENTPKGPLWEEISSSMKKLGYNRNSKRCKEKWENINKYFKKVKESSKQRKEDSKTCPYFHQLDALYRHKINKPAETTTTSIHRQPEAAEAVGQIPAKPSDDREDSEDYEGEEEEEEDGGSGGYEMVKNNNGEGTSSTTVTMIATAE